jgi:hypothetical protein
VPGIFGHTASTDPATFWGSEWFDRGRPFILALGIGKVALLAACAALWGRSTSAPSPAGDDRAVVLRALAWSAAGFTVLALGRHALFRLELLGSLQSIPLLRYPVRFFLVPTFAICLLAAFGADRWIAGQRRRTWGRIALVGAGALALAAGVFGALGTGGSLEPGAGRGIAHALARSAVIIALLGVALTPPVRLRWGQRALPAALVVLAVAEPLVSYATLNPTAPAHRLTRTPAVAAWLAKEPGRFRIWRDNSPPLTRLATLPEPFLARTLWFHDTLHPSYGLPFGLSYALNRTGDETDTQRTATLAHRLARESPAVRARVFGVAGIRYLLGFEPAPEEELEDAAHFELPGPDLWVWRNRLWLPTARWVPEARVAPSHEAALGLLLSEEHDPRTAVILELGPGDEGRTADFTSGQVPGRADSGSTGGIAEIVEERPTYLKIHTRAEEHGYLVLSDQLAPGWTARLDGARVPVLRADYLFRGVPLPPGEHTIEFEYRPYPARIGVVLSLATLAALIVLGGLGLRRPRSLLDAFPRVL